MRRIAVLAAAFVLILVVPIASEAKPPGDKGKPSPLNVAVTADGHLTRTSNWTIDKTVTPDTWERRPAPETALTGRAGDCSPGLVAAGLVVSLLATVEADKRVRRVEHPSATEPGQPGCHHLR